MKNSTIIGIGGVALGGVVVYLYLKGKKSTTSNSTVSTPTTPTDDTKLLQDLGVTITPKTPTPYVKPVEGVPLLTSENIQKALLSLNIDQTRSVNELSSPNYIEARKLATTIQYYGKDRHLVKSCVGSPKTGLKCTYINPSNVNKEAIIKSNTIKLNALGYKLLANYDIEKM